MASTVRLYTGTILGGSTNIISSWATHLWAALIDSPVSAWWNRLSASRRSRRSWRWCDIIFRNGWWRYGRIISQDEWTHPCHVSRIIPWSSHLYDYAWLVVVPWGHVRPLTHGWEPLWGLGGFTGWSNTCDAAFLPWEDPPSFTKLYPGLYPLNRSSYRGRLKSTPASFLITYIIAPVYSHF